MLHAKSGEALSLRKAERWCGWNRNPSWRAASPASLLSSLLSPRCGENLHRKSTGYRTSDVDPNEGAQAVLRRCARPIPLRDPAGVRMKTPMPVGRGADVASREKGRERPSTSSRAVQNEPVAALRSLDLFG